MHCLFCEQAVSRLQVHTIAEHVKAEGLGTRALIIAAYDDCWAYSALLKLRSDLPITDRRNLLRKLAKASQAVEDVRKTCHNAIDKAELPPGCFLMTGTWILNAARQRRVLRIQNRIVHNDEALAAHRFPHSQAKYEVCGTRKGHAPRFSILLTFMQGIA